MEDPSPSIPRCINTHLEVFSRRNAEARHLARTYYPFQKLNGRLMVNDLSAQIGKFEDAAIHEIDMARGPGRALAKLREFLPKYPDIKLELSREPSRSQDLVRHRCITERHVTSGGIWAWKGKSKSVSTASLLLRRYRRRP
jgi:hypothetical protein